MGRRIVCPNCGKQLNHTDGNFNVLVTYSSVVLPSNDGGWVSEGPDNFFEYGNFFCNTCGETFKEFKEIILSDEERISELLKEIGELCLNGHRNNGKWYGIDYQLKHTDEFSELVELIARKEETK